MSGNVFRNFGQLSKLPMNELKKRSILRKRCDENGFRLPGAPWAFQLSYLDDNSSCLVNKTVGFQSVTDQGFQLLLKKKPLDKNEMQVAVCYVEGQYPPQPDEVCEQWRIEGVAVKVNSEAVLKTAPPSSFAQIMTCSDQPPTDSRIRAELVDRDDLINKVITKKAAILDKKIEPPEIDKCISVYDIVPSRVELLVSGESIWERFEWRRQGEGYSLRRINPY